MTSNSDSRSNRDGPFTASNVHSNSRTNHQTPSTTRHSFTRTPHETEESLGSGGTSSNYLRSTHRRRPSTKTARSSASPALRPAENDTSSPDPKRAYMASYRTRADDRSSRAPLIDIATHDWKDSHDYYVSDEDDAFYAPDNHDFLIDPKWKAMMSKTLQRIPRRVQRYFAIYFVLLVITYLAWKSYIGPQWERNREELRKMERTPKSAFGSNVRPGFTDMIQLKTMDSRLLPGPGNENGRLIFVGDVHGCREELEALLKKADFNQDNDHLILTGDIINKGPDSRGVVALAQSLSASCVRGNHEDKVLLSIAEMRAHHAPLPGPEEDPQVMVDMMDEESFSHGDYEVRKLAKQFSDEQIKYLQQCPVILKVGAVEGFGELIAVHAGLVPGVPLERQDPFQCMNMRTIDLDTRLPKADRDGTPWEKFWNHQQAKLSASERATVIYGHDSKRGKNIRQYSKGLDSGCVNGGKLTALVIEAGKSSLVSVKCKTYNKK